MAADSNIKVLVLQLQSIDRSQPMKRSKVHLTLFQKALILIAVPLAFEFVLLWCVYGLLQRAESETYRAEHAKAVIGKSDEVVRLLFDSGIAFLAYDASTKPVFERTLVRILRRIPSELLALEELVQDNGSYLQVVHQVQTESSEAISALLLSKKDAEAGEKLNVLKLLKLRETLNHCVEQLGTISGNERKSRIDPAAGKRLKTLVNYVILLGAIMSGLIALFMVVVFHQGTTKRLNELMSNSIRMGKRESLAPPLEGDDEIARLDRSFHSAADLISESARKERAAIENAADVICTIDEHGVFTTISPAASVLWGWSPDDLLGKNWSELLIEEDRPSAFKWASCIRSGETEANLENKITRTDGNVIDMLWSAHWSSRELSFYCVAHDITERKELERFKQEFAAMVSHDLRTPLAAVQSTLAVLGRGAWGQLTDRGIQKIATAESNITRSIEMINTLLDLEKMESGKLDLNVDVVSLQQLLKRSSEAVTSLAERKRISINLPDRDALASADSDRLLQVVINLLGNAIKFSPEDSCIDIGFTEADDFVTVSVIDQGPGIPAEQKETIFDRYHQLNTDLRAKKEGSGLGLAICKSIIEAHGGVIGVASNNGGGSTFWFRIPSAESSKLVIGVPAHFHNL